MGILSKADEIRMLAINQLHDFVKKEEDKYLKIIKKWKKEIPKDSELADPEMLAGSLTNLLKFYDNDLGSIMRGLFGDNKVLTQEYYVILGKYFVDREVTMP